MRILLTCLLVLGFGSQAYSDLWYVDANHPDAENKTDDNWGEAASKPFKTIAYAVDQALSDGDTLFVKAGLYNWQNDYAADPSAAHPEWWDSKGIKIENSNVHIFGYYGNFQAPPMPPDKATYDSIEPYLENYFPVIEGLNRSQNVGIETEWADDLDKVTIKNLYVKNFQVGIQIVNKVTSTNRDHHIDNVLVANCGDTTTGFGICIWFHGSNGNMISNCVALNGTQCAMNLYGNDNTVKHCSAWADEGLNASHNPVLPESTDYYFDITGSDNTIEYCRAERHGPVSHGGHGFAIQGWGGNISTGNTISHCYAHLLQDAFLVRGPDAKNNVIEDCTAVADPTDTYIHGKINIDSSAENNIFRRIRLSKASIAVAFQYSSLYSSAAHASLDNKIENCVFELQDRPSAPNYAGAFGLYLYHHYDTGFATVKNTRVANCTFVVLPSPKSSVEFEGF